MQWYLAHKFFIENKDSFESQMGPLEYLIGRCCLKENEAVQRDLVVTYFDFRIVYKRHHIQIVAIFLSYC